MGTIKCTDPIIIAIVEYICNYTVIDKNDVCSHKHSNNKSLQMVELSYYDTKNHILLEITQNEITIFRWRQSQFDPHEIITFNLSDPRSIPRAMISLKEMLWNLA